MSRGIKKNPINDRISIHWMKVAHRELAKASDNQESVHHQNARQAYIKAKRIRYISRYQ